MPQPDDQLTGDEIQEIVNTISDPIYRYKDVWIAIADAQRRKSLWWVRNWIQRFCRDHDTVRILDGKLKDMGIEPWESPDAG